MASNPQQLEEGNTHDYGSTANTSSIDELPGISALMRGAVEVTVIQSFDRLIRPRFESLARRVVVEELQKLSTSMKEYTNFRVVEELQKLSTSMKEHINLRVAEELLKLSTNMKENPASKASALVPNKFKLQFSNKISQSVFTGKDLQGENKTPIEIVLVDALTGKIVNVGTESAAKLEIVALQVGDDDGNDDDTWTNKKFEDRIVTENNGTRILRGNTRMQLKEGIGYVGNISFTQSSNWTKRGLYRLGARVLDVGLMNTIEAARTEAFLMEDHRNTLYRKHCPPSLSDEVYRLKQISFKGDPYKRLRDAKVYTVKDLLTLLHKNPKQLEEILDLKASSKIWRKIVNHALTCDGMFLYLDSSNERKTGVVLDVKLQLKGLILESHQYIPADQLSDRQKVDTQKLVMFASENFEELESFEDETSLKTSLNSLSSANQSLGTCKIIDGPPSLSSKVTHSSLGFIDAPDNLDNRNLHMGQSTNLAPIVTSQSGQRKETLPFDKAMINSMNYHQQDISFDPLNPESPNGLNFGTPTERHAHNPTESAGTSSQAVKSPLNTGEHMNELINVPVDLPISISDYDMPDCSTSTSEFSLDEFVRRLLGSGSPHYELRSDPDTNYLITQTVSVSASAQTRWTKVSKLLRRLSVRERIGLPERVQPQKKQRCF